VPEHRQRERPIKQSSVRREDRVQEATRKPIKRGAATQKCGHRGLGHGSSASPSSVPLSTGPILLCLRAPALGAGGKGLPPRHSQIRNAHLVSPLSPGEDAAALVRQTKRRPLRLACFEPCCPSKVPSPGWSLAPELLSKALASRLRGWSSKASQNELWQEPASPTVPLGSFPTAQAHA